MGSAGRSGEGILAALSRQENLSHSLEPKASDTQHPPVTQHRTHQASPTAWSLLLERGCTEASGSSSPLGIQGAASANCSASSRQRGGEPKERQLQPSACWRSPSLAKLRGEKG